MACCCGPCSQCFQQFGGVPSFVSIRAAGNITMAPYPTSGACGAIIFQNNTISSNCGNFSYDFDLQVTLAMSNTGNNFCLSGSYATNSPYLRFNFNMFYTGTPGGFAPGDTQLFIQIGHPCQVACAYTGVDVRQNANACNRSWWESQAFALTNASPPAFSVNATANIVGFQL